MSLQSTVTEIRAEYLRLGKIKIYNEYFFRSDNRQAVLPIGMKLLLHKARSFQLYCKISFSCRRSCDLRVNNTLQYREFIPSSVKSQHLQLVGSNNDARFQELRQAEIDTTALLLLHFVPRGRKHVHFRHGSEYQMMDNVPKLNFRIKYHFRNKL